MEQSLAHLYSIKSDKNHTHDGTDITSAVANAVTADTAIKLQNSVTISLTGDVTGSATFDGSSNVSINTATNSSSGGSAIPGQIAYFAMNTAPTGFLKANGAIVSRTTYAALFAAIGTTYGAGDGSTTFALPDGRGVFPRGFDDGRGLDSGRTFGSYQADMFANHAHGNGFGSGGYAIGVGDGYQCGPSSTGGAGGNETRPKNIAWLCCIKY